MAARADDLVICEKRHYLRGRDLDEMNRILRDGAREGGFRGEIEAHPTELAALQALIRRADRGDVCAVMAHVERSDLFEWLEREGFGPVGVERLASIVAS
jgi:cyanophycin synthetase